ncbi:unnamed protein product [Lactuca virosa]|uniref:Uncharacterized protein n=1 Tax=Lactuca virosa TaxID=75947 RepID=A0AAU9LKS7_9ASTR|nr:unnamed protein product [Lactuca virosa]
MEVQSSSKISISSSKLSSKRFLFDKRYGYVYDEWREPSEVALAYGRGMFCIVPLGKALLTMVSESVNFAASRTIQVVERPDQLSPQSLQAKLNNNIMFPIKNIFGLKHISISPLHVTSASSHSHAKSHE